jgi:hypothetical protein
MSGQIYPHDLEFSSGKTQKFFANVAREMALFAIN